MITLSTIKSWFVTDAKPTQSQFWDTWDSFWHKEQKIPLASIDGVDELFAPINNHFNDDNAHAEKFAIERAEIEAELLQKADLIDGKIPVTQIPVVAFPVTPDASETQGGLVNTATQKFKGNKTVIGESELTGNAFEVQNLSHVKLLQIANNKSVGLNVNPISNIGLSVGRGVFGGAGSSNFTVFADNTGTDRVLDVLNTHLLMYKGIFGYLDLPITANVELSLLYGNPTNGSITLGTSTTNGTHAVISNFERNRVNISTPIRPPAGSSNGVYNCLDFRSTIDLTNISGTAIARAYYIHPALSGNTTKKEFRAIESSVGGGYFNVGLTANVSPSAVLQSDSTTQGFLPPRMTTAQKNAIVTPVAGLMVFDTTLMKLCIFTTVWETITSI